MEEKWLKKLHTAGRLKELRMQGITKRWVINILGVIALFFVIVFVVSAFTIRAYYYNAVESILNSGASTTATNYFSGRLDGGSSLEASAADFIDSFSYRDKTTIWIINNAGGVVTSSSGFAVDKVRMPDYEEALAGDTGRARYVGHITDNGEKCMAVTRIIYSGDGEPMGAVRVISSLEMIDRQISTIVLLIFLALVLIFAVILYSNLFFIRSIIIPVQEINQTTKKISQGDYTVRIEKKYNDEIGDLADSINQMAEDISATDKMKNDFISTISHELRTPLAVLRGELEAIQDGVRKFTPETVASLQAEVGTLTKLVDDLHQLSMSDEGALAYQKAPVDLIPLLEVAGGAFRERFASRGLKLQFSLPDSITVFGDRDRLMQLFNNLLENSLRYTDSGGSLQISAGQRDKTVRLTFADSAPGVSDDQLQKLFERFYRTEGSRNRASGGSGLGLAICLNIVEAHNGRIIAAHSPFGGVSITVELPLERDLQREV